MFRSLSMVFPNLIFYSNANIFHNEIIGHHPEPLADPKLQN